MEKNPSSDSQAGAGPERFADMFGWWSTSHVADPKRHAATIKVLQTFAAEIQELVGHASARHADALGRASENLTVVLARAAIVREPRDILSLQGDIGRWMFEMNVVGARSWIDLTEKAHECCHRAFVEMTASAKPDETRDRTPKDSRNDG